MNGFSRRSVLWLVGLCGVSFVAALVFGILGGNPQGRSSSGPDSVSVSAIGHRAFIDLLRQLDIPVVISTYATETRGSDSSLTVVAEPQIDDDAACKKLNKIDDGDGEVLVVLPRWTVVPDPTHPGFAGGVAPVPRERLQKTLDCLGSRLSLAAGGGVTEATIDHPHLVRFVAGGEPVLLARFRHNVSLLADPTPMENYGLDDGDNAAYIVGIVEERLHPGGVVIYDETLHGHVRVPSLWQDLFSFPWSLVAASAIFALAALLFARTRRFGAPSPVAPAIAPGKLSLIDNTAALLAYGGHAVPILERYLAAAVADVVARGRRLDFSALEAEVKDVARNPTRAVAVADRIHRARQEALYGSLGPRRP